MKQTVLTLMAACLLLGAAGAQEQPTPVPLSTDTALHWSGGGGATHVFLLQDTQDPANRFRLFVAGGDDLKVIYRTQLNSRTDVRNELQPKKPVLAGLREYEFTHKFSRMTVWMGLVFVRGDVRDDELTRTFYGGIGNVVPNGEYLKDKTEK
jgi:hypothetical protein